MLACSIIIFFIEKKKDIVLHAIVSTFFLSYAFYLLVYPRIRIQKNLRKSFEQLKHKDAENTWEIKEECVVITGPLGFTEASWEVFEKAVICPDGILLSNDRSFYWLPKHCFSEDDFDLLAHWVRRKIEKIKVL